MKRIEISDEAFRRLCIMAVYDKKPIPEWLDHWILDACWESLTEEEIDAAEAKLAQVTTLRARAKLLGVPKSTLWDAARRTR